MKICIASKGADEESFLSEVSARAPYFLIFENGELIESIKNPFVVGGGAGYSAAHLMDEKGVQLFVSGGKFGPVLKNSLEEKGIKMKQLSSSLKVKDALKEVM